jgi:hypothetical protein
MPQTGFQKFVFSIMMAPLMVYGMEVYNALLMIQQLKFSIFIIPVNEIALFSIFVIVIETIIGGPLSNKLASNIIAHLNDKTAVNVFLISTTKVIIMCPLMSLVAAIIFKGLDSAILAKWIVTFLFNLPMAFLWQIIAAGPIVRSLFKFLFRRQIVQAEANSY